MVALAVQVRQYVSREDAEIWAIVEALVRFGV